MVEANQIDTIRRLFRAGASQRAICRRTGVARNTVRAILNLEQLHPDLQDTLYDVEDPVFSRPPQRCSGCGAVVYMPCLACQLRSPTQGTA